MPVLLHPCALTNQCSINKMPGETTEPPGELLKGNTENLPHNKIHRIPYKSCLQLMPKERQEFQIQQLKITQGEPQKSCSKPVAEKVTESCQEICQCRPPPLLPPPPPPPPPPRLLAVPTPKSTFCPTEETWWPGLVIIIAVCCATLVFLFVVVIICYKAIKRMCWSDKQKNLLSSDVTLGFLYYKFSYMS
ncbi:proline-rich membrane anchor 1 [Willisornis vidua]|uniref:Proline-rich membrane anchor 1 n=1 Tax=Willisornis vidua TaxID=1566151 RepID=A0ABQ9CU33_9PASS|nr:proline-rich membrane anchor 1 [Willisornis vidua]